MSKLYYVLVAREAGYNELVFGDYVKQVVAQERVDTLESGMNEYKAKDLKVIKVNADTQSAINDAVANAW